MEAISHPVRRFAAFELDTRRRQLRRDGDVVSLQPKAFDLLVVLVESSGHLVTKDDLLARVWPGQIVEESNLTVHMSALRKALGERKEEHRFVVTEPGRGYRFVADVTDVEQSDPQVAAGRSRSPLPGKRGAALLGIAVLGIAAATAFVTLPLTRNGQHAANTPLSSSSMKLSRLTSSGQVAAAAISPDGKYFAYATIEMGGQSLHVRQAVGGRSVQIAAPDAVAYWGLTGSRARGRHHAAPVEPAFRYHVLARRAAIRIRADQRRRRGIARQGRQYRRHRRARAGPPIPARVLRLRRAHRLLVGRRRSHCGRCAECGRGG
jgi:DNA-binding winged helix-turn-helix (wHTH) protein